MVFNILYILRGVKMEIKEIKIRTEYITTGQLLKIADIIPSGGMAKFFLSENEVYVDGVLDLKRKKKLYPGMTVEIPGYGVYKIV